MPSTIDIATPDEKPSDQKSTKEVMLENMASSLEQKFAKYSGDRMYKEDEWIRAIRQYEGQWSDDERTKIEQALWSQDSSAPPPPVNITRPKTNMAIARMKDSQFPTGGDFNFILSPSPMPELLVAAQGVVDPNLEMQITAEGAGVPQEEVPTPGDIVNDIMAQAESAAVVMAKTIQDDLVRTSYGRKARLAIEDLAILGSAVVKGPVLTPHVRRMYTPEITSDGETIYVLGSEVVHSADVFRVDPRLFYPDPSARMSEEIEDCFELHIMTRTDLAKLGDAPSFMRGQVINAISAGTSAAELPSSITTTSYLNSGVTTDNRFVVKEYHGPIDKQVLLDGELITEEDAEDELAMFFGEVWLCNGFVIRLSLNYIEGIQTVPYGVAAWERDPGSVFGHGVPWLIRNPQHVVNNAYLLLLDNASLTSGPQIVLNKEMIEPASKESGYDIAPMKVWFLTEYGADVREAMQFVNVPAQMEGISQIIDMAMQFADIESSTPLMQQGDIPVGNNTLTGVGKVMSATNINQKNASTNWDDSITIPLINRMYHHEMQYGANEAAKGDMEVKIGGATERIDSEVRAQELERPKAFRQLAVLSRAGDILRTPAEVAAEEAKQQEQAQAAAQQDPATLTAQANMVTAQTRQQTAQMDAQVKAGAQQLEQAKLQLQAQEMQLEAQKAQRRDYVEMQLMASEREMSMMKMANENQITMQQLGVQLKLGTETNQVKRDKIYSDLEKFNKEIDIKLTTGEGI
jgi:hypothetical protein